MLVGKDLRKSWLTLLLTIKSGRRTPIAQIPTPDFAVPYAAPKHVKTIAEVHPIAPKNGYFFHQQICSLSSQCPLFQPHSIYIECTNRRSTDRVDRAISRELAKFCLLYNEMLNSLTIDWRAYLRSYYVRAQTRTSWHSYRRLPSWWCWCDKF